MAGQSPRGRPPTTPVARSPHRACRPRGQYWAPTPAHPRSHTWVVDPDSPPGGRAAGGGGAPDRPQTPLTTAKGTPPGGRPSATPTARNAGPQGREQWGRCWVPTPAPTAPGTHGSQNPGCPPQRTGGRGRDGACHQTPLTTMTGHPPLGQPPTTPAARSPRRACKPRGQCWAPTAAHPRPQHMGSGTGRPAQRAGTRGKGST